VNPRDVRVHVADLGVIADDAPGAIAFLRTAERALPAALDGLADELGEEVLVVRRIELREEVLLSRTRASFEDVRRALRSHLGRLLEEARERAVSAAGTSPDGPAPGAVSQARDAVVWYPSEAALIGRHLEAAARGALDAWPARLFADDYGRTWTEALRHVLGRGVALAGDVLASIARLGLGPTLAQIDQALAVELVALWTAAAADREQAMWASFPDEVRARVLVTVRADLALAAGETTIQAPLVVLAHLFAVWPPARVQGFARRELGDLAASAGPAAPAPSSTPGGGDAAGARQARIAARAGGLVFWARIAGEAGFEQALADAYREERERRAVRWALGRALEVGGLDVRDPLLLVWSGEDASAPASPSQILAGADPAGLHALATRIAAAGGHLASTLRVAPFSGGVIVLADRGVVVDALDERDPHEAVAAIASGFARRAGRPPAGIEVLDRLPGADLDAVLEIDVPSLPEAWRRATWTAASALRARAVDRWRLRMADARGWPATLVGGDAVVLVRRNVDAIAAGSWLPPSVSFAGAHERRIDVIA